MAPRKTTTAPRRTTPKTPPRVGQSTARPVLGAQQKRDAAKAAREAKDAARTASMVGAGLLVEHGETEDTDEVDAALATLDQTGDAVTVTVTAEFDADQAKLDAEPANTLAASRAAATAAAAAGTLPPPAESPRIAGARAQATSTARAFAWERDGHPLDPNEILVTFLIDRCSDEHTAPNQGRPFINENGRVFLHTEWFMAWILDEYNLVPPKSAVSRLFRDHDLWPRTFPFPGETYARGLYQGAAPKGTENIPRRGKATRAPAAPKAPPSPEIEALGDHLCLTLDAVLSNLHDENDAASGDILGALDKTDLAWLADRVARHLRTLKS